MNSALQHRYVVDARGRKTGVILSMRDYRALVRELEDLRDAQFVDEAEASTEGFVEVSELREQLAGKLP